MHKMKGGIYIKVDRRWAMPNKHTFSIKPVGELIEEYMTGGVIIDPFANNSKIATITNDLDPCYDTDYHMDATDFLKLFDDNSVDMILYDPPYSSRQVSECYRKMDMTVNMQTTQNSYWTKHKKQIQRIIRPGGIAVCCGWNSGGIGRQYGFSLLHVRLIAHGGHHNDTIVTVEQKI